MVALESPLWQLLAALPLAAGDAVIPAMDANLAFRILSRAIHIVCAIILGGGIFYMRSVLAYSGPDACFAGRRQVWSRWVMVASTLLIVSGLYNFMAIVAESKLPDHKALPPDYHMLFGIKVLLSLAVMFIAAIVAGKSAGAEKARARISRWLNVGWFCVMAIVIIGAMMRMLH
jgi:putative copper export protein